MTATDKRVFPKPPPPVVGKVTHFSIELYWSDALERLQEITNGVGGRIRTVLQESGHSSTDWGNVYTGFGKRHVIESLEADKKYSYRMCFKNETAVSEWSQAVAVHTTREPLTGEHLHKAVRMGDVVELRKVLEAKTANVEATDNLGFTPLMQAAKKGNIDMMELLFQFGADVNAVTGADKSALMLAAFSNQTEACQFLLDHAANINCRDKSGSTALHAAVDGQAVDALKLLLLNGADANAADFGSKWTALIQCAATNGNVGIAKSLITGGAALDYRDNDGKTALMIACINGHYDLTKQLLESGADVNVKNQYGKSSFDIASSMDRVRVAKLIQEFAEKRGIKLSK